MDVLDKLTDGRVKCLSIMTKMTVGQYLSFVTDAYTERGGIEGQRAPLRTRSAMRIRSRMVDDIKKGAVLPPVVLGLVLDEERIDELSRSEPTKTVKTLEEEIGNERISIIDGMQRTTAVMEVQSIIDSSTEMRVEFWIAESANSLIYRMLILNAGQIPWSLSRQLNVVFYQFIDEAKREIEGLNLIGKDAAKRRVEPGQYQASDFVHLFLLFGTRRDDINLQDQLADEFARLDLTDSTSHPEFIELFFGTVERLVKTDVVFSRATLPVSDANIPLSRFKDGKDIFSSHPARIGFVVAFSQHLMGDPGVDLDVEEQKRRYQETVSKFDEWIEGLKTLGSEALFEFLRLPTLDEIISRKRTGKVGEYQRQFFLRAFSKLLHLLINSQPVQSMEPCWRAHI